MYSQQQYPPQQQQYSPQYQQQQYSPQYQQQGMAPMQSQTTMVTQQQPGMMMAPAGMIARESCRSNARCVAYVDIVIAILDLIGSGIGIMLFLAIINEPRLREFQTIAYIGLFFAGLTLICCIVDLVICCGLLKATDMATPPQIAVEKAKCYRCWCIFMLILNLLNGGTGSGASNNASYASFLWFLLRIAFLVVVCKFIEELEYTVVPVMGMGMGQTTTMMTTTAPGANPFGGQQQQGQYQPQGSPSSQQQPQPTPQQQGQ